MKVAVRAMPAQGHDYRRRAGRAWGKQPVTLAVVDAPKDEGEISPDQLAQLQADPHIVVQPIGGGDSEAIELKAQLADANARVAQLRKELADHVEAAEAEMQRAGEEAGKAGERIRELEGEVQRLQGELAKRARK